MEILSAMITIQPFLARIRPTEKALIDMYLSIMIMDAVFSQIKVTGWSAWG